MVSAAETEEAAGWATVEWTAEGLDAEVAALVSGGEVLAAVGYPDGTVPVAELVAVTPGVGGELTVPGLGTCSATSVRLEHPPRGTLVVGRCGSGLSTEETSLLRGIAHASAITMRMLRLLGDERAAREEGARRQTQLERLVAEQAALRRVATLVAHGASPPEVFSAVAAEVRVLLGADVASIMRFEPDRTAIVLAAVGFEAPLVRRWKIEPPLAIETVYRTGRPARADDYAPSVGETRASLRQEGLRSAVASPIVVGGSLWGAVTASTRHDPLPADTEQRIVDFTELVATAIANADDRAELTASRARIVAASDATRRRLERDLHDGVQQRLVSLGLALREAESRVSRELPELRALLSQTADELVGVLDELQEISRGIHPAILSQGGLAPAIRTLARRSAVPVELHQRVRRRLPERVEVAAYYVVAEALANAAKHARADTAYLDVEAGAQMLRLCVRDDGVGGADPRLGSGLTGLTDRVKALGGTIRIESPPGEGTALHVTLPITHGDRADGFAPHSG